MGAHLLQDRDEVHDLELGGGAAQLGVAVGPGGGEQHLLGRADRGVGQLHLGAVQAVRGAHPDPGLQLLDTGAEVAQHVEVVVDGPVADLAPAEVGDERLADGVQQGPAQQDRDPGVPGVGVDVGVPRRGDVAGVQGQSAVLAPHVDPVQRQQVGDDLDVLDLGHVLQDGRCGAQEGGHHGLGDEVLGTSHGDLPGQGDSARDVQCAAHDLPICCCRATPERERHPYSVGSPARAPAQGRASCVSGTARRPGGPCEAPPGRAGRDGVRCGRAAWSA